MHPLWRRVLAGLLATLVLAQGAQAWSNHALSTWFALAAMPELRGRPGLKVETLEAFLAADPAGLARLLREEEAWARAHVPAYAPRPEALAFEPDARPAVPRFLAALRVNPNIRLALYLQLAPGQPANARPVLAEPEISLMKTSVSTKSNVFVALRAGETVPLIDVLASAVDEPDYGMDIGLWSDNGTAWGAASGFGPQPFGNPAIEWSSQAPLHMSFLHEAGIVYKAAPYLQTAYPEYRIHLFRSLAAFALARGHDYWGWRFAGWGLHYLQDLTQPYHSRVLPGVGLARMLGINALDVVGIHGPKDRMVQRVTNRHSVVEEFQRQWMRAVYAGDAGKDAGVIALRDTSLDARDGAYTEDWPRRVVSLHSSNAADAIDEALVAAFPSQYVDDPAYIFGVTEPEPDLYAELGRTPAAQAALQKAIAPLLGDLGAVTRGYARSLLTPSPKTGQNH